MCDEARESTVAPEHDDVQPASPEPTITPQPAPEAVTAQEAAAAPEAALEPEAAAVPAPAPKKKGKRRAAEATAG